MKTPDTKSPARPAVAIVIVLIVAVITSPFIVSGIDWVTSLRPATLAFLRLENPYQVEGTFNPPWLFILLAPLAILPENMGGGILLWLNLVTWIVIARKFSNGNILKVMAVLTFPFVVNGLLARNVDFLVMWGLLLRPEFAVFFLAIKPQVGGAAILFLALQAYKEGGVKKLLRLFAAPSLLFLLSILAYGPWPFHMTTTLDLPWNASPIKILGWPSILIGLALFIAAVRNTDTKDGMNVSMASTPFFSPYVGSQSWVAVLPALIKTNLLYAVWVLLWGWVIFRTIQ
jgi:hypothetical protein